MNIFLNLLIFFGQVYSNLLTILKKWVMFSYYWILRVLYIFWIQVFFFNQTWLKNIQLWISMSGGSESKRICSQWGDPGSLPGLGRCPGEGNGNPLQYSCLENSMDRGAWQATVNGLQRVGHDWATKAHTSNCDAPFVECRLTF